MNFSHRACQTDNGPDPYAGNIQQLAVQNEAFRVALWTGCHLQMTLMCIPPCGEIGPEVHEDTDQFIKVEQGTALVKMGGCEKQPHFRQNMCEGDAVFIPAGTWHNVVNTGKTSLKLSSIYAPPHHPRGTVQRSKADSDREEY